MKRLIVVLVSLAAASATGAAENQGAPAASPDSAAVAFDPSVLSALEWRGVGPNRGGRSIAVSGTSSRPHEYYFGATGGGLWKSTDWGVTWAPVGDRFWRSSTVGAIGQCEADPDTVYVGFGEVQLRGNIIPGDGVYKSTDGGTSWTHLGLQSSTGQQMIGRVRVHPSDCSRVYVAALGDPYGPNEERGVFRSTDGGATWQNVLFRGDRAGAVDLALDPGNPSVVYAGFWEVYRKPWLMWGGGEGSGLFKSTDSTPYRRDLAPASMILLPQASRSSTAMQKTTLGGHGHACCRRAGPRGGVSAPTPSTSRPCRRSRPASVQRAASSSRPVSAGQMAESATLAGGCPCRNCDVRGTRTTSH